MVSNKGGKIEVDVNSPTFYEISKMDPHDLISIAYNLNMINELVFENLDLTELRIALINKVNTDRKDKLDDIFDDEKYYTTETDEEGRPCRVYKECCKCGFMPNSAIIEISVNNGVLHQLHGCGDYAAELWIREEYIGDYIKYFERNNEIKRKILSAVSKEEIISMVEQRILNNI